MIRWLTVIEVLSQLSSIYYLIAPTLTSYISSKRCFMFLRISVASQLQSAIRDVNLNGKTQPYCCYKEVVIFTWLDQCQCIALRWSCYLLQTWREDGPTTDQCCHCSPHFSLTQNVDQPVRELQHRKYGINITFSFLDISRKINPVT